MRLYRCWFCSSTIYPGHGITFVRNDSKEFRFCRSKCHKAFKKKRNPRKTKWTKAFRVSRNKDLSNDISLQFEAKRNIVPRYNREDMQKTVEAMKKITEIKERRQAHHIEQRLAKGEELRKLEDIKAVETELHLIQAPHATRKVYDPETHTMPQGIPQSGQKPKATSVSSMSEQLLASKLRAKKKSSSKIQRTKLKVKLNETAMETETV